MNVFAAALCVAAVGATNLRANVSTASLTARINPNISQNAAANAVSSFLHGSWLTFAHLHGIRDPTPLLANL